MGNRLFVRLIAGAALIASSVACGGARAKSDGPNVLRLGYFPNITHAAAIAGLEKGIFAKSLGATTSLEPQIFNAGPEAVEAIFAGALDITYVGPNPAINAYAKSKGQAVRVIAGATSGGAALVVNPSIDGAAALKGRKLATPQRGNTQDVALRAWLARQGLSTTLEGGGDVEIIPQANAQTFEGFRAGHIDGAWVPEPWATRLVLEAGGTVLVDEADLWPGGRFVTTHLMVRTKFLRENPGVVSRFLAGHIEATKYLSENGAEAKHAVNAALKELTGTALTSDVLNAAWGKLTFTVDPIASSLGRSATDAVAAGLLEKVDLRGLYALDGLNEALRARNEKEVAGL